jgi:glycosyltransferase involved in cell wall biosynthesis
MKILGSAHPESGCSYHRIILPLGFMPDVKGYVTNVFQEEQLSQQWDIFFYNRLSPLDTNFDNLKERTNCKIVLDMDDDWILPPNHINYDTYVEFKERIEKNIAVADLVTCTNERLANRIRKINSKVSVQPNALPYGSNQFTDSKVHDERIRIFWCGGISHEKDIEILKNPIKRLKGLGKKILMVLGGYNDSNYSSQYIWDKMLSNFTAGGILPYVKLKGVGLNEYMTMYKFADIMVIPLENSEWHGSKSNLKILEAASKKISCIVSAVEPYIKDTDAPVLWVEKQSDWFTHLNYLINNPTARIELGERLHEWATKKYNLTKINETRRQTFSDLIKA